MITPKDHFSYSQYTLFQSSPAWYFKRYFKGIEYNGGFEFGRKVADSLEKDICPTAELKLLNTFIKKYPIMDYEISVELDGIPIYARFDGFDDTGLELGEYKTGDIKYPWTQSRADRHVQIDWYYLMIYLKYKELIKKATLHYIPVLREKDNFGNILKEEIIFEKMVDFETKRTLVDISRLTIDIKRTWKEINDLSEFYLLKGYVIIKGKRYE